MRASVLIADDEPLARPTLREHLREVGWCGPIFEASDGNMAIAIADQQKPELIFLDIVMPGATGLEVLERLDYEPKVIFTTAHDQYAVTALSLVLSTTCLNLSDASAWSALWFVLRQR